MSVLSQRIQNVKPSPTLMITAKAKALQAQGQDVIGLGSGEPDFDTPNHIKKAAIRALREGFTKYTAVEGIDELHQAIILRYAKDHNLTFQPDQVVVTVGGKQAFYNLIQATLNPGEEVIIPAPYWVSYPDMVLLADGVPVTVATREENGFKMTPQELESAITPKTRFLVINSPSNPTGSAYSAEELQQLGSVLERHPHVWIISDDIYEKIIYKPFEFATLSAVVPSLQNRTVIVSGVSKAYSMTGWRIGYAVGPKEIIKAMIKMQSQSTSNATSIAQKAAAVALAGPQKCIKPMVKAFRERRDFVVKALNDMPGITCRMPEGAFYVFPNVSGLMGKTTANGKVINDTLEFSAYLLEAVGVAVVPGSAFGLDPYFRISFATSMQELEQAMLRIRKVAEELTR
ncbi:MAG: pyridoxal phosphate-dependent aminotransferase [Magnetococcales bacterium]|nr:pyridoxal phosphate-dependent aminotransferase [Magnetococcales bacterium]NGZ07599.1 pyridoxal phosphate-dependent aminotransferase [Magnetococcales bacterium]